MFKQYGFNLKKSNELGLATWCAKQGKSGEGATPEPHVHGIICTILLQIPYTQGWAIFDLNESFDRRHPRGFAFFCCPIFDQGKLKKRLDM